jgi:2-C-methyl-D-erythritol 4-phosphate cytidylyltransferase
VAVVPESSLGTSDIGKGADRVIAGGPTRAASVRRGLVAVPESADVVVVHDAARPLASRELFRAVVDAVVAGADGAIPGVAVVDTVKRVRAGCVVETLDRSDLVAVQTPQAFRAEVLRRAHDGDPEATDDAGLLEALGSRVVVVPGEYHNLKLTSPDDLAMAERWSDR